MGGLPNLEGAKLSADLQKDLEKMRQDKDPDL